MITIGNRIIDMKEPPYFIADIASNHDNSLERAFRLIELAKESGADAAKFQNFKAERIVSRSGFDSLGKKLSHQAGWSKSVYEVYEELSVRDDWTMRLKEKCREVQIEYMTSPYDYEAVDLAEPFVPAYKIGSGDITWISFLRYIAAKNKPVILATGASTLTDVIRAVDVILPINPNLILLQCNTNYTGNTNNYNYVNLNVLHTYHTLYPKLITGLSDHTPGHTAVLGAIALGARVIEKHFTDDTTRIGPDHSFSMDPPAFDEMVKQSKVLYQSLGDGIKRIEDNELEACVIQRRSLYYTRNLASGTLIQEEDLIPLRPIRPDGIPPYEINAIIGRKLKVDAIKDTSAKWEDFE